MIRAAILALTMIPTFAMAQDHSSQGGAMTESAPAATESASSAGYQAAMDKMHKGMMAEYTGDADVDFMRAMIPHHQGAIDMAKVVLENGKDPEVRKMAEGVIAAQEAEIVVMQDWLDKNAK